MEMLMQFRAEILTVVFGVLGAALAFHAIRIQKRSLSRKAFAAGGVSRVIFDGPAERPEEFEVRFRGDVITRLTENHAFFMNTGNVEISADDFLRPACVILQTTEQIYDCQVIASRPSDLNPDVQAAVSNGVASITLTPLLLNPGDFVAVRFIRAGKATTRSRSGRIKGVPALDLLMPGQYASWFTSYPLTMGLMGLGFVAFAVAAFFGRLPGTEFSEQWLSLLPGVFGVMFLVAAITHRIKWRAFRLAAYMGRGTEFLEFQPLVRE